MKVIIDFTVVPIGVGISLSEYVAACGKVLEECELTYQLHANGTNVLHLKPKHIEEWKGVIPAKKIRDWFANAIQPMFEMIDNLQVQSRNAAKARDLLLPKLMNGTLTV